MDYFSFVLMSQAKPDFIFIYCQVGWRNIYNSIYFYASDYFFQCEIQISYQIWLIDCGYM